MKEYVRQKNKLKKNLESGFLIVLGQCSETIRSKLRATRGFDVIEETSDLIELMKLLKQIMFSQRSQRYEMHSLADANRHFYTFTQTAEMSVSEYYERMINMMDIILLCGGDLGIGKDAITARMATDNTNEVVAHQALREEYASTVMKLIANKG